MQTGIEGLITSDLAIALQSTIDGESKSADEAISRALRDLAELFEPLRSNNKDPQDRPERFGWQELRLNRDCVLSTQRLCQDAGDNLPDLQSVEVKLNQAMSLWNERRETSPRDPI